MIYVLLIRMHRDEFSVDSSLAHELITKQFPQWQHLPLTPVSSAGTDNALFRLGMEMVVRLPRIHWAVDQLVREQQWLARLAPALPVQVPVPLAAGQPGCGYPWGWSVCPWLEGQNPATGVSGDQLAIDLAGFVRGGMRFAQLLDRLHRGRTVA